MLRSISVGADGRVQATQSLRRCYSLDSTFYLDKLFFNSFDWLRSLRLRPTIEWVGLYFALYGVVSRNDTALLRTKYRAAQNSATMAACGHIRVCRICPDKPSVLNKGSLMMPKSRAWKHMSRPGKNQYHRYGYKCQWVSKWPNSQATLSHNFLN